MEGCFTFQWGVGGVGVVFQMGEASLLNRGGGGWGVPHRGGIGFFIGGLKKIVR